MMELQKITVLNGPNYWSVTRQKLIVMTIDLKDIEHRPSNLIEGFKERLCALLPSLQTHRCSKNYEGGFLERVQEGTWMGHIMEHIAIEIQSLAGMNTTYGRTRTTGKIGNYSVVFAYEIEEAGRYAAKAAFKICEALIDARPHDLQADVRHLKAIRTREKFGPSTKAIIEAAERRGIPWRRLDNYSLVQFGYGSAQKRIQATVSSDSSSIGVSLAKNKATTKLLLEQANINVPKAIILNEIDSLHSACEKIGFPLVIKPIDGNHGRGITTRIITHEDAIVAFEIAQKVSHKVIIEKHIEGDDYRLLLVDFKLVAVAKRTPAQVIGDGKSTIKQLVEATNEDPKRGDGHENVLTKIKIDTNTLTILETKNLTPDSILEANKRLLLKDTSNLSTGGTAEDVTDLIHPDNIAIAETIARIINLDICGIDIVSKDISVPLTGNNGAVLEVNAGPGLRMHLEPSIGKPRDVAIPIIEMLFPEKLSNGRIPIVAVTGTNGKTTTTRLIAHIAQMDGKSVGFTTSDGVYINNRQVAKGDCTGPKSSISVLTNPTVNFAVLECARGGILKSGLAFNTCDVGIVTNVSEDHMGLKGINSIDQMAHLKSIVPRIVSKTGYAILNADDELVYKMKSEVKCKFALFSLHSQNPRIVEHLNNGGLAAVVEDDFVTIFNGNDRIRIVNVYEVPLTIDGKSKVMIANILCATLASFVQEINIENIQSGLKTFVPSAQTTPGRMNFYKFANISVLVDYAHNRAGLLGLKDMLSNMDASRKCGIISGIGDRRTEDNFNMGKIAAEMFDEIIIRNDRDLRGKDRIELNQEVKTGIYSVKPTTVPLEIQNELEALTYAIKTAVPGSLIVLLSDNIEGSSQILTELVKKEQDNLVH